MTQVSSQVIYIDKGVEQRSRHELQAQAQGAVCFGNLGLGTWNLELRLELELEQIY